jgi:hypothetical protein
LKDGLIVHFSLLAVSHKRQQEEIQAYQREIRILNKAHQEEIKALQEEKFKDLERRKEEEMKALKRRQEEEIKTMRGEVDKLKKQAEHLRLNVQIFPIDFEVENPDRYTLNKPWSSTPFYSHSQGYKLRIDLLKQPRLRFGFSISCYLMRSEFDCILKWPLQAKMKLTLLSQQPQGYDHELSIELKCSKPLGEEADDVRCGVCSFSLINLDPYLRSRCLHIRIVSIHF